MSQRTPSPTTAELAFYRRLCCARFFEGMVAAILELAGYRVFPYGQEQLLPTLRETFRGQTARCEPTEERLRSNPDLLVVAPASGRGEPRTRLVEVKYRTWTSPKDVRLRGMATYRRHWPDAVLVVIIPAGEVFYSQLIHRLNPRRRVFDLTTQFQPLRSLFPRVPPEVLTAFAQDVRRFTKRLSGGRGAEPDFEDLAWSLML